MKILKVEIFSPDSELLRTVEFKKRGLSIIYGEVEKPESSNETTNSIGKTVLLRILNIILGAKNSGKDTIKGLENYIVESEVLHNEEVYEVKIKIGSSKEYVINGNKMNLTEYKKFFGIERSKFAKQIMLEKRKGLLSELSKNPNKEDMVSVLNLLYFEDISEIFANIKKKQEEIELLNKYNRNFKEDITSLKKEEFNSEMKKKQVDEEILILNTKLENLKISENIEEIARKRAIVDQELKKLAEKFQLNNIKINRYQEIINDSKENELSLEEVQKIYEAANVEIPEMIKKKLKEVEEFYKYLLADKNDIYKAQINVLTANNKEYEKKIESLRSEFDELSQIISENDSFREAIKIYDRKIKEKMQLETKISEINSKLTQISNTKNIKANIDDLYNELSIEYENAQIKIGRYKEFFYEMVNKIYVEETRNPYLSFEISDNVYKYKAMPVKIDLSIDGDSGEGLTAVKFLLFDLLIMNFNEEIEFLIEDSACFEGVDRRQVKNLILEFEKISEMKNKQLIISLNKYFIDSTNDIEHDIVLKLSEQNTLLNINF